MCDDETMESPIGRAPAARELFLTALILVVALGCQTPPPQPAPAASGAAAVRNNAASLLYDLLGDEKDVSKLLIIKRDRPELGNVIKEIASTTGAARKNLEKLAREDPTLNLKDTALPPGEKATREAIAKKRAGELLRASGADFELKLLLTQAEALGYAESLAKVAAENESSPERAKVFTAIGQQMGALHGKVLALLSANKARAAHALPPAGRGSELAFL
jgi:hypothetical protein